MAFMALPPVETLLAPVTCMPSWVAKYASLPNTVISSGCATVNGNVNCDPAAMTAAAAAKIGQHVSLQAYTLARYITSEVGTRSVPERVAVAQAAVNRVNNVDHTGDVLKLLLYRQAVGHPNRGFYGPIHGDGLSAPYGRWAATSRDPALSNLIIAIDVLNGTIPPDFSKGADDQYGPEVLIAKQGLTATQNGVRSRGADRKYWVGPLPGVDDKRTFLYTYRRDIDPTSAIGRQLIERGVAAMGQGRPDWSRLPTCTGDGVKLTADGKVIAATVGAVAAASTLVAMAVWRRRRVMV